ncbi:condensin subunit Smc [Rivularia sp. PCC 7116]|uniref:chromosome segregation protein SMC n=1 Tax=Rivularia sp. PCC 7116 TaxID=373994 RepID=UPI00029EEEDC|nr:chromosome segregation protein SMC [Rivularia sp. PCC 7116]AFY57875.1 condensin subunit Smc [Rivularia sp. PCC 7116]
MVHIKRVELTNFKSFGGTTSVPLLPEFTVISGPNGSGKSNILDALLFCLGLSSSKGMRAGRLPDLVNTSQISKSRATVEASVTVTFDLSDYDSDEFDDEPIVSNVVVDEVEESSTTEEESVEETEESVEETQEQAEDKALKEQEEEEIKNRREQIRAKPGIPDWSVTRRLRVTKQGTYSSSYYINGISSNATEVHEELSNIRINPEGYNVVLQGDVTDIISMKPRERREIVDELAGVAAFDRKINQAKKTLEEVKEKEDSCRIIETELTTQCERLSQDKAKAEKYQRLRIDFLEKQKWEVVLSWRTLQRHQEQLSKQIQDGDRTLAENNRQLGEVNENIQAKQKELEELNIRVKALGEDELLKVQSQLATQEAEYKQVQRRQSELEAARAEAGIKVTQTQQEIQQNQSYLTELAGQKEAETRNSAALQSQRESIHETLEKSRETAAEIASASEAWVVQQTNLNHQVEAVLQTLEPQRTERAQLRERNSQLQQQIQEQTELVQSLEPQLAEKQSQLEQFQVGFNSTVAPIQDLAENLAATEQELQIQQQTQKRLLQEQRDKQRQLDKLEAQAQAQQEAQGTHASKIILQSGLPGVCGLVAELGRVEPNFQLALETAAGGRLGQIVVEDDSVGAAGIQLLKQRRAGRATFLPLNKIRAPRINESGNLRYANGFIDYAVNLIGCEPRYDDVFAYVFGNTVVFENINLARNHLGKVRIVTLEGELLETSGAMTGGSVTQRSTLRFGTVEATESEEVKGLRNRLVEIERVLGRCNEAIITLSERTKELSTQLTETRQGKREQQLRAEQLQKEVQGLTKRVEDAKSQLTQNTEKLNTAQSRLEVLEKELPSQEQQLQQLRNELSELEASQTPSEWQQIQAKIKSQEQQLQQQDTALLEQTEKLKNIEVQQQVLQEKIQEGVRRVEEYQQEQLNQENQINSLKQQEANLTATLAETRQRMQEMEANLGEEKQRRDAVEAQLRQLLLRQQQLEWEVQKLQESQQNRREELDRVLAELQTISGELPNPLPEVPEKVNLEELQKELKSLSKRLQAMEPVNMLALEQYDRTQQRLEELSEKLETLEAERTELLLRIENFTTLRQRAFKEAFDAVNENFKSIFATLSDGDGYLQLDNQEDPFNSGLNLVAHPKGKPVQRLASMSGGEKSLTALSFIFALQRYRPSPFYAFDEVDMFLDGANVERLAKMIKQQAQLAQFIVVSLRRPMIESAERTIGVTQARGAYTQVLGIKLKTDNTSA